MLKIKFSLVCLFVFSLLGCVNNSDTSLSIKAGAPLLKGLGNHSHKILSLIHI